MATPTPHDQRSRPAVARTSTIIQHLSSNRIGGRPTRCAYASAHLGYTDGVAVEFDITTRGKVSVGPNGLARTVPRSVRIVVTDKDPYDLDIRLSWDDDEQRLVPDDVRVTRRPDGIPVRAADLGRIQIGQLIEANLACRSARLARLVGDHRRPRRRRPRRRRCADLRPGPRPRRAQSDPDGGPRPQPATRLGDQTGDARPPTRLPRQSHQRPLRRTHQRTLHLISAGAWSRSHGGTPAARRRGSRRHLGISGQDDHPLKTELSVTVERNGPSPTPRTARRSEDRARILLPF